MTRREKALERLRVFKDMDLDAYERGYLEATRFACCHLSIDALNGAADHIERHMQARGVKVGGSK